MHTDVALKITVLSCFDLYAVDIKVKQPSNIVQYTLLDRSNLFQINESLRWVKIET